ncbi:hypothetical protein P9W85_26470 [Bacillus tropicus]|uniref:Uncharacterized protein n=1 Tax=Bacillus thuringiensis serovar kumamotoensis TaxID=132267 RepID=A0A9X6JHX1_BACUK|nr:MULTISPECIES: hypothetical protein [Bacillus cereus group]MEC2554833.1 hypothetical protein [Bacillus tropicus]MEC2869295.1 hypothetical protein [Bacillus cereus]OTZ65788.1 hypothetical protein BK769_34400 [Bacillus thuringiensis serovar kumamtoensis]
MGLKVCIEKYESKTVDIKNNIQESQLTLTLTVFSREESLEAQALFLNDFKAYLKEQNRKAGF